MTEQALRPDGVSSSGKNASDLTGGQAQSQAASGSLFTFGTLDFTDLDQAPEAQPMQLDEARDVWT